MLGCALGDAIGELAFLHGEEAALRKPFTAPTGSDRRARSLSLAGGCAPADVTAGQSAALIQLGAWPEAEALLESALALTPDDARLHNNRGVAAREQEHRDAARVHFARAADLAPNWDLPRQNLGELVRP